MLDVLSANAVSGVSGGAKVAVLQMPMHPMVPKLQRMLLGVCRRNRCQVCLDENMENGCYDDERVSIYNEMDMTPAGWAGRHIN